MDLYPVYVKYDVTVTTNIAQAGVPSGAGVNIPAAPTVADGGAAASFNLPYNTYTRDTGQGGTTSATDNVSAVSYTHLTLAAPGKSNVALMDDPCTGMPKS